MGGDLPSNPYLNKLGNFAARARWRLAPVGWISRKLPKGQTVTNLVKAWTIDLKTVDYRSVRWTIDVAEKSFLIKEKIGAQTIYLVGSEDSTRKY